MEAGPGVALELRWLDLADESSGSAGACSSHRIALTGFRLGHLLSRFSRNRESGGAARCHLPNVPRGSSKRQVSSCLRPWELTVPGESLGPTLAGGHLQDPFPKGLDLGLAPCGRGRIPAADCSNLAVALEDGTQCSLPQFGRDHRRASGGRAHARQRRPNDRTLHRRRTDDVIHCKKSSKFNWDCTICRSCRWIMSGSAVLK